MATKAQRGASAVTSMPRRKKNDEPIQNIELTFDTQRIRNAKVIAPVEAIMLNASPTEAMSFEQTVRVAARAVVVAPSTPDSPTLATRIGRMDFHKSQALMLLSASFMGILIGLVIALFI